MKNRQPLNRHASKKYFGKVASKTKSLNLGYGLNRRGGRKL